jgi:hypothetical protein
MATKVRKAVVSRGPNAREALVELFIAEDVRAEAGGKVTLVGMYPDRVIVALVPPDAPGPSSETPFVIDSLGILVTVRNLVGEHQVSIEIGGKPTPVRTTSFSDINSSVNLVAKVRPLQIHSLGVKTIGVVIDGVTFPCTFEVRRGDAQPDPQSAATTVEPRGKKAPVSKRTRSAPQG